MAFSNLSLDMQNLVMLNFEFFAKLFIFFGLLYFAIQYSNNFNAKDKSKFAIMRQAKGLTYILSKIYIFTFFLNIFYFYPQVSIDVVLQVLVTIYGILFTIFGAIIIPINTLLYGSAFASDLLGVENKTGTNIRGQINNTMGLK